jgi:hypothetical protein
MTQQSIEPSYITSEQSKLLKKKGFDWQVCRFYTKPNAKIFAVDEHGRYYPIKNTPKKLYVIGENFVLKDENAIPAPEQWEVCEWLRLNHGIWISVQPNEPFTDNDWCNKIYTDLKLQFAFEGYSKPQEAYSAAFDYVLNKK